MTYEQINNISLWIAEAILACLQICGVYNFFGIWGLFALAIFVACIAFVGWAIVKGLENKFGDFDNECLREGHKQLSNEHFFSI